MPISRPAETFTPDDIALPLIERVVRPNGLVNLFGRAGKGKTRLLWQAALEWSQGRPAFGLAPAHALRIHFIQVDMLPGAMADIINDARLARLADAPPGALTVTEFADDEFPNILESNSRATDLLTYVRAVTRDHDVHLTIVDAMDDTHDVDPGDLARSQTVIRKWRMATCGRAIIYVKHERKPAPGEEDSSQVSTAPSYGSIAWEKKADSAFRLVSNGPESASLIQTKARLGPPMEPIALRRGPYGFFHEVDDPSTRQQVDRWLMDAKAKGTVTGASNRALARACSIATGLNESTVRRYVG